MNKLHFIIIMTLFTIITISTTGCESPFTDASLESTDENTELLIDENDTEDAWECAKWDFYEGYMEELTSFDTYDDYYHLICYMLLNHIDTYEFTIEDPDYGVEEVHGILEDEMAQAYDDVTLFLNSYTDFWSKFQAECSQTMDSEGNILSFTYTFVLSQKDGLDSEDVQEEVVLAEERCEEVVNELFEGGMLTVDMTEQDRAYVIYQWVGANISYAYDAPATDSDELKPDNCYNAMVEGEAVCQGITGAYVMLCRLAGVEMYVQLGNTMDGAHSWCKMLDEETGEWMYIDPTWAITGAESGEEYTDKWFWVTQEYMESYERNPRTFTEHVD